MGSLVALTRILDALIFAWLMIVGLGQLIDGQYYPACALICTAVVYQRFEKAAIIKEIHDRLSKHLKGQ